MLATANLFARGDTFFGVCAGVGEDFGFHPNILRAAFGVLLLVKLPVAVGLYVLLGLAVLSARLLFPVEPGRSARRNVVALPQPRPEHDEAEALPLAA